MHLHCQVIIFRTDVLCQQVNGFGATVTDSDLRPVREEEQQNREKLQESEALNRSWHVAARCHSNSPEFSLVQVEVVFLLGPSFKMFCLLLSLQHLQLRLSHGLFTFSLQTQLFYLYVPTKVTQLHTNCTRQYNIIVLPQCHIIKESKQKLHSDICLCSCCLFHANMKT